MENKKIFLILSKKLLTFSIIYAIIKMSRGVTPHLNPTDTKLQNGKRIGRGWKVFPKNFSKTLKKVLTRLAECAIIGM